MELTKAQVDLVIHVLSFAFNVPVGWDPTSVAAMAISPRGYLETPGHTLERCAEEGRLLILEVANDCLSALTQIATQIQRVSRWPATIELDRRDLVGLRTAIDCYVGWWNYERSKGWTSFSADELAELAKKHSLGQLTFGELAKKYGANLEAIRKIVEDEIASC